MPISAEKVTASFANPGQGPAHFDQPHQCNLSIKKLSRGDVGNMLILHGLSSPETLKMRWLSVVAV